MREVLERYCSFMPVEIFLSKEDAPQEYEEVKPDEVKEDDVVVGPVHHDAVTREEDDGKGGKKTVEVEPAKDMVKINKRPVSISDIHSGRRHQVSAPMTSTRISTARCSMITASPCSGSI